MTKPKKAKTAAKAKQGLTRARPFTLSRLAKRLAAAEDNIEVLEASTEHGSEFYSDLLIKLSRRLDSIENRLALLGHVPVRVHMEGRGHGETVASHQGVFLIKWDSGETTSVTKAAIERDQANRRGQ